MYAVTMQVNAEGGLRRRLNLTLLILYGLGTILGAGIYVLIGKVAGYAGMLTPLAFIIAAVLAGLTAFSYAELASRYPRSAGVALYVYEGFRNHTLARIIGLLIVAVGVTSTAALMNGLLGYLGEFIEVQRHLTIVLLVALLALIVIWGIKESVLIAGAMTVLEVFGLLMIVWVARDSWSTLPVKFPEMIAVGDVSAASGVLLGAFVAFYAYIGFEDMVNVAEEVKQPQKNLPRGVIVALVLTTTFYVIVAVSSVLSVAPSILAGSDAPLALIYQQKTGMSPLLISAISIISILNGAIIQMIMASRLLYGMSRYKWLPGFLANVHPRTATPINASLVVAGIVLVLALSLPLLSLAKLTSFFTLIIFSLVNLALWRIKTRNSTKAPINIPTIVPILGFAFCLAFVLYQVYAALN